MLRRSGRVSKILVAVLVALVVIGAVGLAILPEIVRRVAVSQAAKITGRVLSLEDVDLNLFTGHLALKGFKLAQRNSKESALEFERLDVRLGYLPLLRGNARVTELALVAPTIRVTRTGPEEFDFSDLLARRGSEESSRAPSQRTSPSKWTVTLDRLSVRRLTFVARDLTTAPASEWRIGELTVDARDLTTRVAARSGRVETKLKLNGAPVTVTTDSVTLEPLAVAPSREGDEVKKKIGLPLGMIVALITDSDNGIRVQVPLSGELNQVRASVGDAVWTAVKNALVNIVGAPFRSIGRLFKGKGDTVDELKVDPVTFAASSAEVVPEMERHLTQVADFLRRAPMIKFALAPITAPRDVENLKAQELTLRIQRLQRDRGLADFGAAVAVEFKGRLPGMTPPKSGEEQLALLREREPAPESRLSELQTRRLEVVREALTKAEGIPADRLLASEAKASDDATEGRIEFQLEQ